MLKGKHSEIIPVKFDLIWLSGFRGKELNVKVYDAKWWEKLAWPLARCAKNGMKTNLIFI